MTLRFRGELRCGERYTLSTRCVGWEEGWSYWEQTFERAGGTLAARARADVAVLDSEGRRIDSVRVMHGLGIDVPSPQLPAGSIAWQASDLG